MVLDQATGGRFRLPASAFATQINHQRPLSVPLTPTQATTFCVPAAADLRVSGRAIQGPPSRGAAGQGSNSHFLQVERVADLRRFSRVDTDSRRDVWGCRVYGLR